MEFNEEKLGLEGGSAAFRDKIYEGLELVILKPNLNTILLIGAFVTKIETNPNFEISVENSFKKILQYYFSQDNNNLLLIFE